MFRVNIDSLEQQLVNQNPLPLVGIEGEVLKLCLLKKQQHIFFFPILGVFSRRRDFQTLSKVCVLSIAPKRLHEFDELNLITHGFHNGNSPVSLNQLMTPKMEKNNNSMKSWESAPQVPHFSQEGLWSPPSSPKKKAVSYNYHEWTKPPPKKTTNPPHCRPANLHHPSPQRPQSFQGLDEILWSKPPGESWCNGPLFWGSKPLGFWSGCIWIQLIGDQVSPRCWLACGSLMFLLDAPLEGHWLWAKINIPTTLWASPFTTKTLFHFGRISRS